jgi:tripartite-type tricarboxylate transporter receptor subunit TctC
MLAFYVSSEKVGRAFLAPPGIPADRVATLRAAYDQAMEDPELLADIKKAHSEFMPLSGEKLQALVAETTRVSPAVVARIRKILGTTR